MTGTKENRCFQRSSLWWEKFQLMSAVKTLLVSELRRKCGNGAVD